VPENIQFFVQFFYTYTAQFNSVFGAEYDRFSFNCIIRIGALTFNFPS